MLLQKETEGTQKKQKKSADLTLKTKRQRMRLASPRPSKKKTLLELQEEARKNYLLIMLR